MFFDEDGKQEKVKVLMNPLPFVPSPASIIARLREVTRAYKAVLISCQVHYTRPSNVGG